MCGIVGYIATPGKKPQIENVRRAMDLLGHRGPDGSGLVDCGMATLGHRRLSIVDLEGSPQPWQSLEQRYSLVFNGEIYNYLELRNELENIGYVFRSSGDTEVLLNMYLHYGIGCLEKLNGMFAFAIWDNQSRSLFMARDRLGKKPLYYAHTSLGLAFSSELNSLKTFEGLNCEINTAAVNAYFAYQFIPGNRTIYQGIHKLPAAHWLYYTEGRLDIKRYWTPPLPKNNLNDEVSLLEELVALVDDAVRLRLRADVPMGAFLSGGIDSAIVVSTLNRLNANLDTFTVGFGEPSFDERKPARVVADYFDVRHHERLCEFDLAHTLGKALAFLGEPFADPSAIPTWHVCNHAREHVTVALSGDGGDELFGGYRRYYAAGLVGKYRKLPVWLRKKVMEPLIYKLPESEAYYTNNSYRKLKLFLHLCQRMEQTPDDFLPQTFTLEERKKLFNNDGKLELLDTGRFKDFESSRLKLEEKMMLADLENYLAEDILTKVDRMSMAHALEVRSPLLDYRVVEFAMRLPLRFKIRGKKQKYLLHQAYDTKLPAHIKNSQKHGFAVPISRALRKELASIFQERVLDAECPVFLNKLEIVRLWQEHRGKHFDHGFKLWSILVFFMWWQAR